MRFYLVLVLLILREAAGIHITPLPRLLTLPGSAEMSLPCSVTDASSAEQLDVTWYKDGQEILTSYQNHGRVYSINSNFTLHVDAISFDQKGIYQCVVSDRKDRAQGTRIQVELKPPYFTSILPKYTYGVIGGDVYLACDVIENAVFEDSSAIKWWFRDEEKQELVKNRNCHTKHRFERSCRILNSSGSRLIIRRLTLSDSGQYTCQYSTHLHNLTMNTHLIVQKTPTFLTQWPTKVELDAGTGLTLSCEIDEPSGYTVTWSKDLYSIQENNAKLANLAIEGDKSEKLHLHNVTKHYSGHYSCIVTMLSPHDRITMHKYTIIQVNDVPEAVPLFASLTSQTVANITWLPPIEGSSRYPVTNYSLTYSEINGQGQAIDPYEDPFVLDKLVRHIEITLLEPNHTYRVTMWANNALGAGLNSSLIIDTFPGSHIVSSSGDSTSPSVPTTKDHVTMSLLAIIASVTSLLVLCGSTICTVLVLVLCRDRCDKDAHRRRYRIPEESRADSGLDTDESTNSPDSRDASQITLTTDTRNSSTPKHLKLPPLSFTNPAFTDESLRLEESDDSGRETSADNALEGSSPDENAMDKIQLATGSHDQTVPELKSASSLKGEISGGKETQAQIGKRKDTTAIDEISKPAAIQETNSILRPIPMYGANAMKNSAFVQTSGPNKITGNHGNSAFVAKSALATMEGNQNMKICTNGIKSVDEKDDKTKFAHHGKYQRLVSREN